MLTSRAGAKFLRVGVAAVLGVAAAFVPLPAMLGPVVGWIVAGFVYCVWTWWVIGRMTPAETREHAEEQDPHRGVTDAVLLVAALGGLAGVGMLLFGGAQQGVERLRDAAVGVLAVVTSWFTVPTLYAVRYADLYYGSGEKQAIDFGDDADPSYSDFAYLAFTLAMTYQVSDTSLKSPAARRMGLQQSMLSYLLGAVVLACVVNLVSSLVSSG